MKIAISQPRYLPALNYLQRIKLSDCFVLLDTVQHQPRAFEHRNRIKSGSGAIWLSIPLQRPHSRTIIKDLKVHDPEWPDKHKKIIRYHYKKADYWDENLIESLYDLPRAQTLCDITYAMLIKFCEYLDITTPIIFASSLETSQKNDALLAEITHMLGGDCYISGPNGRNYIQPENFGDINCLYHDYHYPHHHQLWSDFIPWMAGLDMLLNLGIERTRALLDKDFELSPI